MSSIMMLRSTVTSVQGKCFSKVNKNVIGCGTKVTRFMSLEKCFDCSTTSSYRYGKHRSYSQAQIIQVPVIEVEGHVAVCGCGSGALGHPGKCIHLNTVSKDPATCKCSGLQCKGSHHH